VGYRHTNQATHIVTNICSIVNVFFLVSRAEVTQDHGTTFAVLTNYLVGGTGCMMLDVTVIDDPAAEASLDPTRARLLA